MSKNVRLAIVDHERCKPNKCGKECKKACPINGQGKKCIVVDIENIKKAVIAEALCIGCGMCEKACPFDAIQIVNLPTELEQNITHRYGENGFRLYKMPILQKNNVMGILGENGIGKSTIVKILSGIIRPNFEQKLKLEDKDIVKKFKGNQMQNYFKDLYDNKIKIAYKRQNMIDYVKEFKATLVKDILDFPDLDPEIVAKLELNGIENSPFNKLSGGEQQRIVCMYIYQMKADVYIFDEPTNYLDIKQRLLICDIIRAKASSKTYVVVIDHDISILDYVSDTVSIMYGKPGAYGVISMPHNTAEAINMFFDGYIPSENMKFRSQSFKYGKKLELGIEAEDIMKDVANIDYPETKIEFPGFKSLVNKGSFLNKSSVTVVLGENGTGKSSFIKRFCDNLEMSYAVKPQYPNFSKMKGKNMTVNMFLLKTIKSSMCSPMFKSDVLNPLKINRIMDKYIDELSGGEQQRVSIAHCLGKDVDVFILDEPSASLDIEQRVNLVKTLKRFVAHNKKIAFMVEHDISVALSVSQELNSQVIVFEKLKEKDGIRYSEGSAPVDLNTGMNKFLKMLDVTFRKSQKTKRAQINKKDSQRDNEQKKSGTYFIY